jgi:hypothetical protein
MTLSRSAVECVWNLEYRENIAGLQRAFSRSFQAKAFQQAKGDERLTMALGDNEYGTRDSFVTTSH